jgi:hypothetical protein
MPVDVCERLYGLLMPAYRKAMAHSNRTFNGVCIVMCCMRILFQLTDTEMCNAQLDLSRHMPLAVLSVVASPASYQILAQYLLSSTCSGCSTGGPRLMQAACELLAEAHPPPWCCLHAVFQVHLLC